MFFLKTITVLQQFQEITGTVFPVIAQCERKNKRRPFRLFFTFSIVSAMLLVSCSASESIDMAMSESSESSESSYENGAISESSLESSEVPILADVELQIENASIAELDVFSEGYFLYLEDTNEKWGYLDMKGNIAIPPVFAEARPFREGLAGVKLEDKWGVIDHDGKWVVNPQYELVGEFSEGYAPFQTDGKMGYISKDGAEAVKATYHALTNIKDGVFCAAVSPFSYEFGASFEIRNISGELYFELDEAVPLSKGTGALAFGMPNGTLRREYRFYSLEGEKLLDARGFSVSDNGVISVTLHHDKYNIVDLDIYVNEILTADMKSIWRIQAYTVPQRFQASVPYVGSKMCDGWIAVPDMSGIAPVAQEEYGYLHEMFDVNYPVYNVTGIELERIEDINSKIIEATDYPIIPMTYVNESGDFLPIKNYAKNSKTSFSDGLAYYESENGARGYIDVNGDLAIDFAALESKLGEKILPLNTTANEIALTQFKNGYAAIRTEQGHGIIDTSGTIILEPKYDKIQDVVTWEDEVCFIQANGEVLNASGAVVFKAIEIINQKPVYSSDFSLYFSR